MALAVCNGAMMMCSFGLAPSTLMVLPQNRVMTSKQPMATIMENKPMVNILPFGVCNSPANPSNWKGPVFTPGPCIPNTVVPWTPGSPTVLVGNMPALNNNCKLMCMWGGVIQITNPGQFQTQVA